MMVVRRKSTVTFCGAHLMVTGSGAGDGIAMSTMSGEARHRYCRPKPSWPPEDGSARFSMADMLILPSARCLDAREGGIDVASSLPATRRKNSLQNPRSTRHRAEGSRPACQKKLHSLRHK